MRIHKTESTGERLILTGMIVDQTVCGRISAKWTPNLFKSKWANLIGKWCVEYYNQYDKAPGKHVEALYKSWCQKSKDKDTIELVERFLAGLSDEYAKQKQEANPDYVLDKAGEHFSQVRIERLKDDLEADLLKGETTEALKKIEGFDRPNIGTGHFIDIFNDKDAWKNAFSGDSEVLIKYPGLLGKFFGRQFARESFVVFMAGEKKGKSLILQDVAFRAVMQRRKVAFFEAGDMSERQILRRFATRITGKPLYPSVIDYPVGLRLNKDGKAHVDFIQKHFKDTLNWKSVLRGCKKFQRKKIRSFQSYFRLCPYPNDTLHVRQIESQLKEWERENWVPDVVLIDYADILNMDWSKLEGRDRINKTWMQLRRLSQQFHCLIVSATQANAKSYEAKTLGKGHFSEDKRKHAHVTAMYGINQTEEEKKLGVMRINCIELRDGAYLESKCAWTAGCPALGNMAIRSFL